MSDQVGIHAEGAVTVITLERPEKKNAFTVAMYEALTKALALADKDPKVHVVLLQGSGGSFTAGNDLFDFMNAPPAGEESPVFRFLLQLVELEKPLVVAVLGPAIGVGVTMLLHADYVVASKSARLRMPFVDLGLCPEAGSSLLLPLLVGQARASEWLMFAETIDVERAREAGLVNEVVADEELSIFAMARAQALAAKPLGSLVLTKRLIREPLRDRVKEAMALEGKHFVERLGSAEAAAAFQAFMNRRR